MASIHEQQKRKTFKGHQRHPYLDEVSTGSRSLPFHEFNRLKNRLANAKQLQVFPEYSKNVWRKETKRFHEKLHLGMLYRDFMESAKVPYKTPSAFSSCNSSVTRAQKKAFVSPHASKLLRGMNNKDTPRPLLFFLFSVFDIVAVYANISFSKAREAL